MAIEPGRIAAAIAAGDAVTLQKLPEIGKKLAQTIITELADKALALAGPDALNGSAPTRPIPARLRGPAADAIAALMALGQTPVEAEAAVARAASDLGREPENADELISLAFGAA
jgi:Holliday junction DNA helicase RuvA